MNKKCRPLEKEEYEKLLKQLHLGLRMKKVNVMAENRLLLFLSLWLIVV